MTNTSLNISLPEALKEYVKERVAEENFGTPSDYVRSLIREDKKRRDRERLDQLLLEGLRSDVETITPEYLRELRREVGERIARKRKTGG
jgi:antitoxin ParD1/3/4